MAAYCGAVQAARGGWWAAGQCHFCWARQRASLWAGGLADRPRCCPALCVQVGRLWTSLADYFIRRGMFEKARDVYEEGLTSGGWVRGAGEKREGWCCVRVFGGFARGLWAAALFCKTM